MQLNAGSNQGTVQNQQYWGHPMFYQIVEDLKHLHSEKNRQYATLDNPLGNFERTGKMMAKILRPGIDTKLAAALAFMSKQVDGVFEIFGENKVSTFDSLEDKLQDVAVYAIIAMIINRERLQNSAPTSAYPGMLESQYAQAAQISSDITILNEISQNPQGRRS